MKNKHILVLNLLFEEHLKDSFDCRIAEAFEPIEVTYDTVHLENIDKIKDFTSYTHLLLSGSTESATAENNWYQDLDCIIADFISQEKSILGICFGHQFLIRHILGKDHVRKSQTPEIGWTEINLSDNRILNGIDSLKSAVFHYDEVFDLDSRFEITADSKRCGIHGFQVKGKSIWGVQFHPDFMYRDIDAFVSEVAEKETDFEEIHCAEAVSPDEFKKNDLIFKNWIEIS
jgi:GMP synthase (glutamine-hydrolysing)